MTNLSILTNVVIHDSITPPHERTLTFLYADITMNIVKDIGDINYKNTSQPS